MQPKTNEKAVSVHATFTKPPDPLAMMPVLGRIVAGGKRIKKRWWTHKGDHYTYQLQNHFEAMGPNYLLVWQPLANREVPKAKELNTSMIGLVTLQEVTVS